MAMALKRQARNVTMAIHPTPIHAQTPVMTQIAVMGINGQDTRNAMMAIHPTAMPALIPVITPNVAMGING